MTDQVSTRGVSAQAIMRSAAFVAGVNDVRSGRPPNYGAFDFSQDEDDKIDEHWNYERGRQWALLAPPSMPIKVGRELNPKAVALYNVAAKRGYIAR